MVIYYNNKLMSFLDVCLFCRERVPKGSGIEDLEISDVSQYKTQVELGECIICLNDMKPDTDVSLVSCSHVYHTWCLNAWFLKREVCPICQVPLEI